MLGILCTDWTNDMLAQIKNMSRINSVSFLRCGPGL